MLLDVLHGILIFTLVSTPNTGFKLYIKTDWTQNLKSSDQRPYPDSKMETPNSKKTHLSDLHSLDGSAEACLR